MKITFTLLLATLALLLFNRCSDHTESLTLAHQEVAEMTATSISKSTAGVAMIIDTAIHVTTAIVKASPACDYTEIKSFNAQSPAGASHEFKYDYGYTYKVQCAGNLGQSIYAKAIFNGKSNSNRITSQRAGTINIVTTGLDHTTASYTVNADYISNGTYESRVSDKSEGSNTIKILMANVVVRKIDNHILSGTANVIISGHLADQRPYNAGAAVIFNGDRTFTINVRGVKFSVNLESGIATQAGN